MTAANTSQAICLSAFPPCTYTPVLSILLCCPDYFSRHLKLFRASMKHDHLLKAELKWQQWPPPQAFQCFIAQPKARTTKVDLSTAAGHIGPHAWPSKTQCSCLPRCWKDQREQMLSQNKSLVKYSCDCVPAGHATNTPLLQLCVIPTKIEIACIMPNLDSKIAYLSNFHYKIGNRKLLKMETDLPGTYRAKPAECICCCSSTRTVLNSVAPQC